MLISVPFLLADYSVKVPVVYEANIRAFGPGANFSAVTERLDAIRALGTDVLWLMPIQPVGKLRSAGGLGSPYAVADFDGVNTEFGSEADLRRLISEAHRRKMRVILDWVANHTAWDHPWIAAHPDWYTRNAKGEISIPEGTNWQDVADLDFASKPMRAEMIASMKGWVTRFGIDGFRCDTADWVPVDFWAEAIKGLRGASSRPLLMLAEGARADHYAAGFDLTYGWQFSYRMREAFAGKSAREVVKAIQSEDAAAPVGKGALRFSTNHDWSAWEGSPTELYKSPEGVRTALTVAAFAGGAPLIYTGQEVSWPHRIPIFDRTTIDWNRDAATARWVQALFAKRRAHPALQGGTLVDSSTDDAIAFRRRAGREEALVLANVRASAKSLSLPAAARGRWNDLFTGRATNVAANVELPPHGLRVLIRSSPR